MPGAGIYPSDYIEAEERKRSRERLMGEVGSLVSQIESGESRREGEQAQGMLEARQQAGFGSRRGYAKDPFIREQYPQYSQDQLDQIAGLGEPGYANPTRDEELAVEALVGGPELFKGLYHLGRRGVPAAYKAIKRGLADEIASFGPARLGGRRPNSGYGFVPPAGSRKKYQKLYKETSNQDLARLSMNEDLSDTELLYVYQELDRRGIDDAAQLSLLETPEDENVRKKISDLLDSLGPDELVDDFGEAVSYTPEEVANLPDDELQDLMKFFMDDAEAGNAKAGDALQRLWDDVMDEAGAPGMIDGESVRGVQPYVGNSREQSIFSNELVDSILNLPPERLDHFDLTAFPHLSQFDDMPDALKIIAGQDEPIIQSGPGFEYFRQEGPHHLPGLSEDDWRKTFWQHGGRN